MLTTTMSSRSLGLTAALVVALTSGCSANSSTSNAHAAQSSTTSKASGPWYCRSVGRGMPAGMHGNGHHVAAIYDHMTKGALSATDCATLTVQMNRLIAATKGLETKGKAEAAGWIETANYLPGVGTHHSKGAFVLPTPGHADTFRSPPFDPAKPEFLIYGGETADAPLVGVAYQYIGKGDPPPAFAGTNDWWHQHNKTCVGGGGKILAGAEEIPDADCQKLGGFNVQLTGPGGIFGSNGNWLLHVWLAPYEYRPDVFASANPCVLATAVAPLGDPCWKTAHRDASLGIPPGAHDMGNMGNMPGMSHAAVTTSG